MLFQYNHEPMSGSPRILETTLPGHYDEGLHCQLNGVKRSTLGKLWMHLPQYSPFISHMWVTVPTVWPIIPHIYMWATCTNCEPHPVMWPTLSPVHYEMFEPTRCQPWSTDSVEWEVQATPFEVRPTLLQRKCVCQFPHDRKCG